MQRQPLTIGIVDDETAARSALGLILSKTQNYKVLWEAESGEQALQRIEEEIPDVMLVDIIMPGMSGLDLMKLVKQKYESVQFVMLTMHRDFSYAVEAMRGGALDYLLKDSYDDVQLFKTLDHLWDNLNSNANQKSKAFLSERSDWVGLDGCFAGFVNMQESQQVTSEQFHCIKTLYNDLKDEPILIKSNIWFLPSCNPKEDNIMAWLKGQPPSSIYHSLALTNAIKKSSVEDLDKALAMLKEKFYQPDTVVVSGRCYDTAISHSLRRKLQDMFDLLLLGSQDAFLELFPQECEAGQIAPENARNFIVACMQDWISGMKVEFPENDQIHLASSMHELMLIVRSFVLHQQLESENGEKCEIKKVKLYIRDNLEKDLSLQALADMSSLSPSYLSALFKQQTGQGLKKFIINERLSTAAQLLKTTNLLVYEIAQKCGFLNVRYFADAFSRAYGISPTEYREKGFHG